MSLAKTALYSFKWSILGEFVSRGIGPLVFLILARILVPEDFGVVAAATVVISFSQVFWDAGLAKALVQRQERVEEAANVAFWINLALAAVLCVPLLLAADVIGAFFQDARLGMVIRVLTLQLPLAALASVHTALMQKDFQFERLFWIRLVTTSAPALGSVPLALAGAGYWSLVAGTLVGQVAQTFTLWRVSPWRPRWQFDGLLAGELWRFGRWAMLSALLIWFYTWMDAIVVGHYLGPRDMGLYRTGNALVIMIFGVVFTPLLPVLYSAFSRIQDDVSRLRNALLFVVGSIAIVAAPMAMGMILLRDPLAYWIFSTEWDGIALVIALMAFAHGVSWVVGANGEVYRATGRPHLETYINGFMLVIYAVAYVAAVQYGLEAFLWTRALLALVAVGLHIWLACAVLEIKAGSWLKTGVLPFVLCAAPATMVMLLEQRSDLGQLELISTVVLCALGYLACVMLVYREHVSALWNLIGGQNR